MINKVDMQGVRRTYFNFKSGKEPAITRWVLFPTTLEATQGQISGRSSTDATTGRQHLELTEESIYLPQGYLQGGEPEKEAAGRAAAPLHFHSQEKGECLPWICGQTPE